MNSSIQLPHPASMLSQSEIDNSKMKKKKKKRKEFEKVEHAIPKSNST